MISAKVHRVSIPSPRNSTKFCVNNHCEHPATLTHAILQAKAECLNDLCANRPARNFICSTVTGEILVVVTATKSLEFHISRLVDVYDDHGVFLYSATDPDDAIAWIMGNGYQVLRVSENKFIVSNKCVNFAW